MTRLLVYHISTFSPTQCGIATYTEDLIGFSKNTSAGKVRMLHDNELSQSGVSGNVFINDIGSYDKIIKTINNSQADVVSLQHEFGIFGGKDGEYVVQLVQGINKPIITTLHTTLIGMEPFRKNIIGNLIDASKFIVVLTEESRKILASEFNIQFNKIRVIRHGIPSVRFSFPETSNVRKKIKSPLVFVSAGHLRPTKGYDVALRALAKYYKYNPHFKYQILGTEQPQSKETGGKEYRVYLQELVRQYNLGDNVVWVDKYLKLNDLLHYILAADIGLVTYTESFQNSSGILPMILGCGRLVVSTDFDYARSAAKIVDGIRLAEINNPDSVYEKICEISQSRNNMQALMYSNYFATRNWIWEKAAAQYEQLFCDVLSS